MDRSVSAGERRLLGRRSELDVVREALDEVSHRGTAINVYGEPGIGKSAVLATASGLAQHRGYTVLVAGGSEAESHLPFASLYALLHPLLDELATLPEEHRDALRRAFGLSVRTARSPSADLRSDQFFLGLAAIELVTAAAARSPVLLVADDVHWWDSASREMLAFLARRISDVRAVLVSATRSGDGDQPFPFGVGTPMRLPGLTAETAQQLLRSRGPGLTRDDERLVLKVAEGNPLALIELPVGLTADDPTRRVLLLAGRDSESIPLTSRLSDAFAARLTELSDDSRMVLLVAAALDGDRVSEVLAGAAALAVDLDIATALDEALRAELVTLHDGNVRFRHPLVRTAVLHVATAGERRAVHRALALAQAEQPDRAAWHRGMAALGPDEAAASALSLAGEHAVERGAPALAAGLFERAAALSIEDQQRGHRLLKAAELAFELGHQPLAERLMSEARRGSLLDGDHARLAGLDAVFNSAPGSADDIRLIVRSARDVVAVGDRELGAYLLVGAARRCLWSSASDDVRALVLNAAADSLSEIDPKLIQITAFVDPLGRGAELVSRLTPWTDRVPDPITGALLGVSSFLVADFDRTLIFVARARAGLQQQGRSELLAQALVVQAMAGVYLGRFTTAQDAAVMAYDLTRETEQPIWGALATFALAHLHALHARTQRAVALTDDAERVAVQTNNRALLNRLQLARGLTALGAGQPTQAFGELRRLFDSNDLAHQRSQAVCAVDYLAESAVSAADRDEARALLGQVESLTYGTSARGVRQAVALAGAILAPDESAEPFFLEARRWAAEATPWYGARVDLALGAWLHRQQRPTEAGRTLRSARSVFQALDTPAWAARADRELEILDQSRESDGYHYTGTLSAQELAVAQRAARGLSNREIAEQLNLSTRTVASHLYRLFPKLGVNSRTQLHLALAARPTEERLARNRGPAQARQ